MIMAAPPRWRNAEDLFPLKAVALLALVSECLHWPGPDRLLSRGKSFLLGGGARWQVWINSASTPVNGPKALTA